MVIISHRGTEKGQVENSLSSFKHLLDNGIKHFEIDVRLSRDNVPLVIHDNLLLRLTKKVRFVSNLTLTELRQLQLKSGEKIATLEEVLDFFKRHHATVFIDVKKSRVKSAKLICRQVVKTVSYFKINTYFISFNDEVLDCLANESDYPVLKIIWFINRQMIIDRRVKRNKLSDYSHLSGFVIDYGADYVLPHFEKNDRQLLILGSRARISKTNFSKFLHKNVFGIMRNNALDFKKNCAVNLNLLQ